eukprot:augustus_masked-scaffold_67-processed-gene-0.19-mRNA-1 protein AED:1.00 eAED:1.00 QI:0/-1/0/0/-1/1/1/0/553
MKITRCLIFLLIKKALCLELRDLENPVEPICAMKMSQQKETWCHRGVEQDIPYFPYDVPGGDCVPYMGIYISNKRWIPDGKVTFTKVNDGYNLVGYFKKSCHGLASQSENPKNIKLHSCVHKCDQVFSSENDDQLLVLLEVRNEVNCTLQDSDFEECPMKNTGCLDESENAYFSKIRGVLLFPNGKVYTLSLKGAQRDVINFPEELQTLAQNDGFRHLRGNEYEYVSGEEFIKKITAPVNLGKGGNLHNDKLGFSLWFEGYPIGQENEDVIKGDFNMDLDYCSLVEDDGPDYNPEEIFNDTLNFTFPPTPPPTDSSVDCPWENIYEEGDLCLYEFNPGGGKSNHFLKFFRDDRRLIPSFQQITFGSHFEVFDRTLKMKKYKEKPNGFLEFEGYLFDELEPTFQVKLEFKAIKSTGFANCSRDLRSTDAGEGIRSFPMFCPKDEGYEKEFGSIWEYFAGFKGKVTLIGEKNGYFEVLGECVLEQGQGMPSAQFGYQASGKQYEFGLGKDGLSSWARLRKCKKEMKHLEESMVDVNAVVQKCPRKVCRRNENFTD